MVIFDFEHNCDEYTEVLEALLGLIVNLMQDDECTTIKWIGEQIAKPSNFKGKYLLLFETLVTRKVQTFFLISNWVQYFIGANEIKDYKKFMKMKKLLENHTT